MQGGLWKGHQNTLLPHVGDVGTAWGGGPQWGGGADGGGKPMCP